MTYDAYTLVNIETISRTEQRMNTLLNIWIISHNTWYAFHQWDKIVTKNHWEGTSYIIHGWDLIHHPWDGISYIIHEMVSHTSSMGWYFIHHPWDGISYIIHGMVSSMYAGHLAKCKGAILHYWLKSALFRTFDKYLEKNTLNYRIIIY